MNTEFAALVENIYYSVGILDLNWNSWTSNFVDNLQRDSIIAMECKDLFLYDTVKVIRGIPRYPFGYSVEDKFRIYFAKNISDNFPIYVIINAQFLHLNNVYTVMSQSIQCVLDILKHYSGESISDNRLEYKLSRIDICNHTTKINMDTYIKPNEYFSRVCTKLKKVFPVIEKKGERGQETSYYRYGSGELAVRFYNKVREICEQQYKAFFFKKWLDIGLIDEKTFWIYDYTYRCYGDYRIDYLYSHLMYDFERIDEMDRIIISSMYRGKNSNAEKYECYMELINKYNIELVPEVVNVEFQLRSEFLKTLKLEEYDDIEKRVLKRVISNMDIFDIFENSNLLYNHLTTRCFRVVSRSSNTKRLRDAKVDKTWIKIQNCKVLNCSSEFQLDPDKIKFYREYNKEMKELNTLQSITQKLAHLTYIANNNINYDNVDDASIVNSMFDYLSKVSENELEFKDRLLKQLHLYGEKKA